MARIKGIDLPNEKRIEIALTYIYGIGRQLSRKILTNAKVNFDTKAKDITEDELIRIREEVNNLQGDAIEIDSVVKDIEEEQMYFHHKNIVGVIEEEQDQEEIKFELIELKLKQMFLFHNRREMR